MANCECHNQVGYFKSAKNMNVFIMFQDPGVSLLQKSSGNIWTAWWCNVPILKNHGVKVNGVGMTSLFYEMENKKVMFETTNQNLMTQHDSTWLNMTQPSLVRVLTIKDMLMSLINDGGWLCGWYWNFTYPPVIKHGGGRLITRGQMVWISGLPSSNLTGCYWTFPKFRR